MMSLASRLQRFINAQPRAIAQALQKYCRSVPVGLPRRLPSLRRLHSHPYWIAIPVVLARRWSHTLATRGPRRAFLHDVLWAQYCLYLSVRIKDDLFDAQVGDRRMLPLAELFHREAEEALARHFGERAEFWAHFRTHVLTSVKGIEEVDALQRGEVLAPRAILRGFASTSSIFQIGATAVCLASGRGRALPLIGTVANELAIGTQIVDDVRDIVEDLKRGRFNYAARMLLKGKALRNATTKRVLQEVLDKLISPGPIEDVIEEAVRHFRRAHSLMTKLRLPELEVVPLVQETGAHMLVAEIHQRRVDRLFRQH